VQFHKFVVSFDDGRRCEAVSSSRDLLRLERDGINPFDRGNIESSYVIAWATLQRLKRAGVIEFDVPETAEELMDQADLLPVDDEDPEGNGSGQGPITG